MLCRRSWHGGNRALSARLRSVPRSWKRRKSMLLERNDIRRRDAVIVFVFSLLIFAYFMPQWADWNIDSRLDLVHAIVDRHTLSIDGFHYNTWDKAVYKGHFYSDKAPGTAMLGVPVYALFVAAHRVPGIGGAINLF